MRTIDKKRRKIIDALISMIEDPDLGLTVFDSKRWSNDPPNVNIEIPSSRHSIWVESPRQYKTICTVIIDIFLPYDSEKMSEKSSLLSDLDDLADAVRMKIETGETPEGASFHELIWDLEPVETKIALLSGASEEPVKGFCQLAYSITYISDAIVYQTEGDNLSGVTVEVTNG
ncbi:MAG: hypothetical protein M3Q07_24995 [Pseudobdellovibrionaceae bacterium]|nr:hypothetical protein [Pseudobdellovibrionaceae bacterium]